MRWFHEAVDRLHVTLASRLAPPVFRHGVTSPSLHEHVEAVRCELPMLSTTRRSRLTAHTLVGALDAGVRVRRGPRPDLPVVIYHHGIAEIPYDKTFRGIFRGHLSREAHLVAVRAPYHRSWLDLLTGLATLRHFLAMCAVSLTLIEAVRIKLCEDGARGSLVVGTSLGGFLTLLHHLIYNTADGYVPLLAGPDLAHVLLDTHYRRFLAPQALRQAETIRTLLDFRRAFHLSDTRRIFPLLASYDLDMLYAHHAACYAASGVPVVTIERGHITGSLAFAALRAHVHTCLHTLPRYSQPWRPQARSETEVDDENVS